MSRVAKKIREECWVACLATNSLLEILKQYARDPYQITEIKAFASQSLEDIPFFKDENYGIKTFKERDINSFSINYKINWDKKGIPTNPITPATIILIENKLSELGLTDASTESVKLIFKDKEFGKKVDMEEEEFLMELESDPVDDDKDKAIVKEFPVNEALIKHNRFQYRVMHVKKLIDLKQTLTKESKPKFKFIINWTGKTIRSINSPTKVAQYLKDNHLGIYGFLKMYGADEKEVLVLISVTR